MLSLQGLQENLAAKGFYKVPPLIVDGINGSGTRRAVDGFLKTIPGINPTAWGDARKLVAAEQAIYREMGIDAGVIDGLVGEQTRYARSVFLARAKGDKNVETFRDEVLPDTPSRAEIAKPKTTDKIPLRSTAELIRFYGQPGDTSNLVKVASPIPFRLAWDPGVIVHSIQCHKAVSDSLARVLGRVRNHYGLARLEDLRLTMFGGCFNNRLMRGGSQPSTHSWGIALDFDPERNQLKWGRNLASLDDPAYDPWWQEWEAEGWTSLGRRKNYDWMHVQRANEP